MNLKRGDRVKIISGKDRGKTGSVLKVFPDSGRVTIEGLNLYKKRVRPKRQGEKGETVSVPRPMNASKAELFCSNCKKATRIGLRIDQNKKIRYCKKCGASI